MLYGRPSFLTDFDGRNFTPFHIDCRSYVSSFIPNVVFISNILFTFFGDKCFSTAICEPYILAQCHGVSINKNVYHEATSEYAANPDLNINNNNDNNI